MAFFKGRDALFQIDNGASGYYTIAGLTASDYSSSASFESYEHLGSNENTFVNGPVFAHNFDVSGIFSDAASAVRFKTLYRAGAGFPAKMVFADGDTLSGTAYITGYSETAGHSGAVTFSGSMTMKNYTYTEA